MSNSTFEQFGYKSAHDLMNDLARDITDGGELIAIIKPTGRDTKMVGVKFEGSYWIIIYHGERVSLIDYKNTLDDLFSTFMGVLE